MSDLRYRNLLGCLAFIAGRTRPDIMYAVNLLSQFQSNPGIKHWQKFVKIVSDERKWNLDGPDGNIKYWHDLRKEPRSFFSRQNGGGSVMVWAAFSFNGQVGLAFLDGRQNSPKYIETLENHLMPFAENIGGRNCVDLSKVNDLNLKCYSGSDFAANRDDRVSIGGYILFLDETPISWRTFKQRCVSLSTMEAECEPFRKQLRN
ncbi:hypothetical protein AVEN_87041-1 [Araneus ventricosus]|uniref:Transposable element Tc3 transposase n=1 Tax=Araneus ventricosus TaxID=182803 RepID=A0A4Y2P8T3_ARAVE|nr:hypothetical protein AVEN_87041-1 [Araneus ventricosus]